MKNTITKSQIKSRLLNFDEECGSIIVRDAASRGSHTFWLTGNEDDYDTHCYGHGLGWSDQSDECRIKDIDKLVDYLYEKRHNIGNLS